MPSMPWPGLLLDQTGSPLKALMFLSGATLSHSVDEACFSFLLESSPDVRSRALALSSALPHAGDWLHVVPSKALGLHLMDSVPSILAGDPDV